MSYTIIKKLPTSDEIIQAIPLSQSGYERVARDLQAVRDILEGKDNRLLMIVGPCSAWPQPAVLQYAEKLVALNEELKDTLKIIMRVYIQKPRTTKGWTGPVNQPNPFSPPDIEAGVRYTREMMVKIVEMGLAIADEALFTHNAKGFQELLSWVAIGARTAEGQEHRIFASSLDAPVGMKNPTHGSLAIAINGVIAAQHPHVAVFNGYEVQTHGNAHAHLVLRGSNQQPNYSVEHLTEVQQLMEKHQVQNPAVVIDASHDNCLINGKKDYHLQSDTVLAVIESIRNRPELKRLVKGFMVESFLKEGNQAIEGRTLETIDQHGLSITDPCLGWEDTKAMLRKVASRIRA